MALQEYRVDRAEAKARYDLSDMPLDDAVDGLRRACLSGTLAITTARRTVCFTLVHGQLASVASSHPDDRFGLQLVAAGAIDLGMLYSALIWQHQQRLVTQVTGDSLPRLGEVLCDLGHLRPEAISEVLHAHALKVYEALTHEEISQIVYQPSCD